MTRRAIASMAIASIFVVGVAVAIWLGVLSIGPSKATQKNEARAKASQVDQLLKEDELNRVSLREDACDSLGIEIGRVEQKPISRARDYGGEAAIPPGRSVTVSAPVGGMLRSPLGDAVVAGVHVRRGQQIFQLVPLLTAEGRTALQTSRVEARGQVESTAAQLEAARAALDRAHRLLQQGAGSRRAIEEAQSAHDVAARTHDAAEARWELISRAIEDGNSGVASPLSIEAPQAGILRALSAFPDQIVPSGALLFEVIDTNSLWIRVAIPAGDLKMIALGAAANVGELTSNAHATLREALAVAAPPSATAATATVDLYYEIDNRDGVFYPGERVVARLTLNGEECSRVVPWSAIVQDIYGGAWLYQKVAERSFARRRVLVRHVSGDWAALADGPKEGTEIVVVGAQELFGVETGFSK